MTRQRLLVVAVAVITALGAACAPMPPDPDPVPVVSGVDPSEGPEAGGTEVTITGEALGGATEVSFGGEAATFDEVSDTELTATAPAGTGTVDVLVTTPAGTSVPNAAAVFTYLEPDPDPGLLPGTCLGFESNADQSVRYDGPADGSPNLSIFTNGDCSGQPFAVATAVFAADPASAEAACVAIDEDYGPALSAVGTVIGAPAEMYLCGGSIVPVPPDPGGSTATIDVGGQTVTVVGPDGSTVSVASVDLASLPEPPGDLELPVGALSIDVEGVAPGSVVLVSVVLEQPVDSVLKLIDGLWDPFAPDGTTGAFLSPDGLTITLVLQDGGRGDTDGAADGKISDPLLPVIQVVQNSPIPSCYTITSLGPPFDVLHSALNVRDNATLHTVNSNCGGAPIVYWTVASATSQIEAAAICVNIDPSFAGGGQPAEVGSGFDPVPVPMLWYCPNSQRDP